MAVCVVQTCDASCVSAGQVMNRLNAFSSSRGGLSHAFTMEMVQQAIKDWSLSQGKTRLSWGAAVKLPVLPRPPLLD